MNYIIPKDWATSAVRAMGKPTDTVLAVGFLANEQIEQGLESADNIDALNAAEDKWRAMIAAALDS